jgi:hypothetical protein
VAGGWRIISITQIIKAPVPPKKPPPSEVAVAHPDGWAKYDEPTRPAQPKGPRKGHFRAPSGAGKRGNRGRKHKKSLKGRKPGGQHITQRKRKPRHRRKRL